MIYTMLDAEKFILSQVTLHVWHGEEKPEIDFKDLAGEVVIAEHDDVGLLSDDEFYALVKPKEKQLLDFFKEAMEYEMESLRDERLIRQTPECCPLGW